MTESESDAEYKQRRISARKNVQVVVERSVPVGAYRTYQLELEYDETLPSVARLFGARSRSPGCLVYTETQVYEFWGRVSVSDAEMGRKAMDLLVSSFKLIR